MSKEEQRVAMVTGGTRGLGRAISIELAQRGYHLILNYRREHGEAEKTVALIRQSGGSAELRPADLANPEEITGLFAGLNRLDLLVNNAGITRDELLLLMRPDSWKNVLATNLTAVFHCSQFAARLMCPAKRGVIIHIGSSSAASARTGQANYSSAKSALLGMTRSMARELATHGVRVLTVAPGFTASDMAHAVPDTVAQLSLNRIPLGRWGRPEEISRTVAFLASDAASGFSGHAWMVDGGRTAFETEVGL
ncbi:3-oxoacyl-(acyl-carrier-protein) reductase [Paraburkholderia ribeironis]|uniref:3-oxoacyl-(Acyl-carrier-protein) reductase n=1 Tax=Paraburkholderia ribeironis TaxID=1247936 RepID=A0A1N7S744_9BURK|nr:3-oxoacyl-ACP reductase family protein [Paraburkholderia ribeironis]SIT43205.1 3-oxoacyl-(acyl-carrier-protein) reductase [Paraburkholderia ribeironis]